MMIWALPGLPAAAAIVALVLGAHRRRLGAACVAVSCLWAGGLLASAIVTLLPSVVRPGPALPDSLVTTGADGVPMLFWGGGAWLGAGDGIGALVLRLDPLAAVVLAVAFLITALASAQRAIDGGGRGVEVGHAAAMLAALAVTVLAADVLLLWAGWQLLLILSWWQISAIVPDRVSTRMLIGGSIGGAALGLAFVAFAWDPGTLAVGEILGRAPVAWLQGEPKAVALAMLLLIAALSRAAVAPFHAWVPGCARGGWSILAVQVAFGALAGVYLLARFQAVMVLGAAALALAAGLGAITAVSSSLAALAQRRANEIVGCIATAQMGIVLVGIGTGHFAAAVLLAAAVLSGTALALAAADRLISARQETAARPTVSGWLWGLTGVAGAALAGAPLLTPASAARAGIGLAAVSPPIGNVSLWFALALSTLAVALAVGRWLGRVGRERGPSRPWRLVSMAPLALAAATLVFAGAAGIGDTTSGSGLAARFLGASLRLPQGLSLATALADPPVAAPAIPALVGAALGMIALLGLAVAATRAFVGRRSGAPMRRSSPWLRICSAARRGWYVDQITASIVARPLLGVSLLLRRGTGACRYPAAWRPVLTHPLVAARVAIPALLGALVIGGLAFRSAVPGPEGVPLAAVLGVAVAALSMLALCALDTSSDRPRQEAAGVIGAAIALQVGVAAGSGVPWLLAALAMLVLGGSSGPGLAARLRPLLVPMLGGSALLAWELLGPSPVPAAASLVGYGMLLGWFPFHGWRMRGYIDGRPAGAMLLAGAWTVAVFAVVVDVLGGSPGWTDLSPGLSMAAGLGAVAAAPIALGHADLRGLVGGMQVYTSSAAILGLAAWNPEALTGATVLVLASAVVGSGALLWVAILGARRIGPGVAGLAHPAAGAGLLVPVGTVLLLGACAAAGTFGLPGLFLVASGAFRSAPGSVAAMLAGMVGCLYAAARVRARLATPPHALDAGPADPNLHTANPDAANALAKLGPGEAALVAVSALALAVPGLLPRLALAPIHAAVEQHLARQTPLELADPEIGDGERLRVVDARPRGRRISP